MKPGLVLTVALLAARATAQEPFTYETPAWLFSAGDFGELTGDGLQDVALVNRAGGVLQVGFQRPDGGFDWAPPEPTGMTGPSGLALASFAPVPARQIAVCGPVDNRVTLFSPTSPSAPPGMRHVFPGWPSPAWITGFDIDHVGGDDLVVVGDAGGGQFFSEFIGDVDGTPSGLWSEVAPSAPDRTWTLNRKLGEAPVLALTKDGAFMTVEPGAAGPGLPLVLPGVPTPPGTLMTYGYFDHAVLARLVLYTPGQATASSVRVEEPAPGSFGWGAVTALTFPKPLQLLVTIPLASGARLGVLFTDGTAAVFDFNGTALSQRSSLPGNNHELLLPVGEDGMLGISGGSWQRWNTQPTIATLTPAAEGPMPTVSPAGTVSNIIFVVGEPFADPAAEPVFLGHLRDWTLDATGSRGSWSVTAMTQEAGGLGNPVALVYPVVPGASHALPNQILPNLSIRSLEPGAGPALGDVIISPPGGSYPTLASGETFPIEFNSTLAGASIFFRTSPGAAWALYDPAQPPALSGDATVQAYARSATGQSPIRSASYTFGTPPGLAIGSTVDADGDGLPDQWEDAFNAHDPNGDEDSDGATNLEEYLAGTDPRDPTDFPAAPLLLSATVVGSGPTLTLRLEWPLADTLSELQGSDNLLSWFTIEAGITTTASHFRYDVPLANPSPSRRFYRLARP